MTSIVCRKIDYNPNQQDDEANEEDLPNTAVRKPLEFREMTVEQVNVPKQHVSPCTLEQAC